MSDDGHVYKAMLRPVHFATLPMDITGGWHFVHRPETVEGGRYGVVSLPRPLTDDECDRFGFKAVSPRAPSAGGDRAGTDDLPSPAPEGF